VSDFSSPERAVPPEPAEAFTARFARNAAWMLAAQIVVKIASFVFFVVVARGLGTEEFGYFSFVISFVPLFLMFGMWGLDTVVVGEIARHRDDASRLFFSGFLIRAVLGALALLVAAILAPLFIEGGEAYLALLVVGPALFVDELSGFVGTAFKAFEEMRTFSVVLMTNRVVSTALALVALALGGELVAICVVYLIGSLAAFAVAWLLFRRRFPNSSARDFDRNLAFDLLRRGTPLGIAGVLNMAVFRIDSVLLQVLRGPIAVAMYSVAYRFLESFLFVAWTMTTVVFPRIARSGATGVTSRTHEFTMALIVSFYLPLAVGSLFAGEWIVVTLFSERYREAADALPALTAAGVFYGIAYLSRVSAIGLGSGRAVAWIAVAALILNVGLNLVVIPEYGFTGAATVTLVTEVFEALILFAVFRRATRDHSVSPVMLVPVVAAGTMALVLWSTGLRDGAAVAVGAIVYAAGLVVAARVLAPDAFERMRGLLRRRGLEPPDARSSREPGSS
jgi:O-antigen/teichoic acid export membrane protein